jgi:hypothetical protein
VLILTAGLTPIRVTALTVGTPISTLVVEITADDINRRLVYNLEVVDGVASGTIDVPAGEARLFTVTAFDDQHNVTHEGSAETDVSPGNNPPLNIKLKPMPGQVGVTVTFGNYTVLVTPAQYTIDAAVTDQLQLDVTVIDPDDEVVTDPQVQWATTDPTMATVTASGLVTGLADGEVSIVAMYDAVAGLSELTLTGFDNAEVCNGLDDDGDTQIDEGLVYCINGTPAANTDGENSCLPGWLDSNNVPLDGCEEAEPVPTAEVCNGIDDDLDGDTDEGLFYCINGSPAPNTDGENSCWDTWFDVDGIAVNGCEAQSDPREPNNQVAQASNLGTLTLGLQFTVTGNLVPVGDTDWFRLIVLEDPDYCGSGPGPEFRIYFVQNPGVEFRVLLFDDTGQVPFGNTAGDGTQVWFFTGTCGQDDTREVTVRVERREGSLVTASDWTLEFSYGVY